MGTAAVAMGTVGFGGLEYKFEGWARPGTVDEGGAWMEMAEPGVCGCDGACVVMADYVSDSSSDVSGRGGVKGCDSAAGCGLVRD